MKGTFVMKSNHFKLVTVAAVVGSWMCLGALGGTATAHAQSLQQIEQTVVNDTEYFENAQKLEGSWLYTVTIPNEGGPSDHIPRSRDLCENAGAKIDHVGPRERRYVAE